MTPERARLTAAQAKADEKLASIAEIPEGGRLIRFSATDVETGQRLATCFVNYQVDGARQLRAVAS